MIFQHTNEKLVKEVASFLKAHGEEPLDLEKAVYHFFQHYEVRRNEPMREKHRKAGWPFGPEEAHGFH